MFNKEIHQNLMIKMNIKEKKLSELTLQLVARNLNHHQIDKNKNNIVRFHREGIIQKRDHPKRS